MTKRFKLSAAQIKPLAQGHGGCIATDCITVDGRQVGYMYREAASDAHDSGWRFMAGDETQQYMDEPTNLSIYDVNTIANYDQSIIPLLSSPVGSAFGRDPDGQWVAEDFPVGPDA